MSRGPQYHGGTAACPRELHGHGHVGHDPVAASYADRVVFLADGTIVDDVAAPGAAAIAERLARLGGRAPQGARP